MEARRPKEPRPLAEDLLERVEAAADLRANLVVVDLGQPRMRQRVAAELVALGDDPLDVVGALAHPRADDEEGRASVVLAQEVEHQRRPGGRAVVERQREWVQTVRTKRPAAAFSLIARSPTFRRTVSCSAAGWASRISTSVPGTKPWS